ncbi:MAG: peptidoglycan-binding protein [Candidatus Doudnabacteria bacterium]|nr:peptidoglycan-binding protein [Candidatus Doudnabacteria bacterium]
MKSKITFLLTGLLFLPALGHAQINASLNVNGKFSTGTDSQFSTEISDYKANGMISILTFADTNVNDIKSASFQDKSGWVKLTPYQSGSDVIAKFVLDNALDTTNGKSSTLRVNFKSPKTYVVGLSLQNANGQTLSSAASPLTVTGPKVLGDTISVPTTPVVSDTFTRNLKYGSSGADVSALQSKLASEGYYNGPVTGFYGRLTQSSVKAYQLAKGIPGANGVVGPATLSVLNQ